MVMEFQGKKATHDFLSLYTRDSSLQLQDSIPRSNNFNLKTQDFLKPLEKTEEPAEESGPTGVAHVLPGGIGTYSICHVAECDSPTDVKPEVFGSGLGSSTVEPVSGEFGSVGFGLWNTPAAAVASSSANAKEVGFRGQWPSSFAARSTTSFTSINPCAQDKNTLMDSVLKTNRGFGDENKEDDQFGKIECASRTELINARVGRRGGNDQKPTTPRSKHSATEQRRRSKINDRFQMLRDLIPNSDQKRDKASFLLEVIEYIRFLQEKVEKYEPSCPGWMEETKKLTPWNNNHVPNAAIANHSEIRTNDHASGSIYSSEIRTNHIEADLNSNLIPLSKKATSAPVSLQLNQTSLERGTSVTQQRSISDVDNMASESHGQWLKPNDYSGSSDMLNNEHEDLIIDEGTISVSTAYSQNLLNTLNQALESSGIDMSQANLSVNINFGKQAAKRTTTAVLLGSKNSEDCEHALKRHCLSPDK